MSLDVLRSELTKLLTLRSVAWSMLVAAVLVPVLAGAVAPSVAASIRSDDPSLAPGTTPELVGLEWVVFGQLGLIVMGVLAATTEYGGQLGTSLVAVPSRARLLAHKALALTLVAALVAIVGVPGMSVLSQLGLGELSVIRDGVPASLLLRWALGCVYWVGMALIGLALGLLFRQALVPLFLLVTLSQLSLILVVLFRPLRFLPTASGVMLFDDSIVAQLPDVAMGTGMALAVFLGWVVGLLGLAWVLFLRRSVIA